MRRFGRCLPVRVAGRCLRRSAWQVSSHSSSLPPLHLLHASPSLLYVFSLLTPPPPLTCTAAGTATPQWAMPSCASPSTSRPVRQMAPQAMAPPLMMAPRRQAARQQTPQERSPRSSLTAAPPTPPPQQVTDLLACPCISLSSLSLTSCCSHPPPGAKWPGGDVALRPVDVRFDLKGRLLFTSDNR